MENRDYETDMERSESLRIVMSEMKKEIQELKSQIPEDEILNQVKDQVRQINQRLREFYRQTYAFGRVAPEEPVMNGKTLQEWEELIQELEVKAHEIELENIRRSFELSRKASSLERELEKMRQERDGIHFYYYWGDGRNQRAKYWEDKSQKNNV